MYKGVGIKWLENRSYYFFILINDQLPQTCITCVVWLSVCICLFICLSVSLLVYLFIRLSHRASIHPCIQLPCRRGRYACSPLTAGPSTSTRPICSSTWLRTSKTTPSSSISTRTSESWSHGWRADSFFDSTTLCKKKLDDLTNENVSPSLLFVDVVIVTSSRYLDPSLVSCDVEPWYVRVTVRGKVLQLVLLEEVRPGQATARRSQVTGHLVVTMPKVSGSQGFWWEWKRTWGKSYNFDTVNMTLGL